MNQIEEWVPSARQHSQLRFRRVLHILFGLGGVLLVAVIFVPVFDGPHSRQHANESVAVGGLRTINALQAKYSALHQEKGYACDLRLLKPTEPPKNSDDDPFVSSLLTGTSSGFKFALGNCYADAKGAVLNYQATAAPVEPGGTGFRAFCTDESGLIWYDAAGSVANCLTSRRLLE